MNRLWELWHDDEGAVVTAELALLGTVGVLGGVVGLNVMARSVNDELAEVAFAFRSLDQSYHVSGFQGSGACVAGSGYIQQDVETSLAELCGIDELEPGHHPGVGGRDCDVPKGHGPREHEHEHGHDRQPKLVPEKKEKREHRHEDGETALDLEEMTHISPNHQI